MQALNRYIKNNAKEVVRVLGYLLLVAIILVVGVLSNFRDILSYYETGFMAPAMTQAADAEPVVREVIIHKDDDKDKQGTAHSRIFQNYFSQESRKCGRSKELIQVKFDSPVKVNGIRVSSDWTDPYIKLGEIMAGVNNQGYQTETKTDVFFHSSFVSNPGRVGASDDISLFRDQGYVVGTDDFIGVGVWMCNEAKRPAQVSPEVIIYYNWL